MSKTLAWYAINKDYVEYLRKTDSRVQHINYDTQFKPYLGIILQISNFDYYVPISSVGNKPHKIEKYSKMKEDIDLVKVYDKDKKLLSVLNINNMIPIAPENVTKVNYSCIEEFRKFNSEVDRKQYIYFLQMELSYLRGKAAIIEKKASKLYEEKQRNPNSRIAKRTCDFDKLEEKCIEYGRVQALLPEMKYITNEEDLFYIYDKLYNQTLFEETAKRFDNKEDFANIQTLSVDRINENESRSGIDINKEENIDKSVS